MARTTPIVAALIAVTLAGPPLLVSPLLSPPAWAVQPDEMLSDPALEARARSISAHLRCLVCQNQSIDDSEAPLARDLRLLVRDRLEAGDSDGQVVDFVVARYGEFVLLKPRLEPATLLLWAGPFIVLLVGAAAFWRSYGGHRGTAAPGSAPALTQAEKRRLKKLAGEG